MDMPELDVSTGEAEIQDSMFVDIKNEPEIISEPSEQSVVFLQDIGMTENPESVLADIKNEEKITNEPAEQSVVFLQDIVENDGNFPVNEIEVVGKDIHYLLVNCDELSKEAKPDEVTLNKSNSLDSMDVSVKKSTRDCEPLSFYEKEDAAVKREMSVPNKSLKTTSQTVQATVVKKTCPRNKPYKLMPRPTNYVKKWDARLTRSLIEIRKEMDFSFKFRKDKNHNALLWSGVLKQLIRKNPYNPACSQITLVECADKWRSLLMTYKINLMKHKQYGEKAVTWEYFDDIHEWMRNDDSSEFSKLIKSSAGSVRDPVPKKKFRIEKTFEKVPPIVMGNKVIITKPTNNSTHSYDVSQPIVINQPTTNLITDSNCELSPDASADYHFAMLILKELEKLPPDVKKRKKQRILLALYE